jgi:hypothetical protein
VTRGTHRFTWDLRLPGLPTAANPEGGGSGPLVLPGTYSVRLTVDGAVAVSQPLRVQLDPRVAADGVTQADLEAQSVMLAALRETTTRALGLAARLSTLSAGADAATNTRVSTLRARLVTATGNYPQPMLIDQLANIWRMCNQADQRPGADAIARHADLRAELEAIEKQAEALR